MRRRSHWAPRVDTIAVAAVLIVFAALVFFTNLLPGMIAGYAAGTLALYAAVTAFVILLLGVFQGRLGPVPPGQARWSGGVPAQVAHRYGRVE